MSTPVLSQLQKKLSLSGKRQKKETIKNVLSNPHQNFWPLVTTELRDLVEVLKTNLPRVKAKKINIPWNILKNVSKQDRKNARQAYLQEEGIALEKVKKDENIIFGVNDATKSLECGSCAAVLVADVNQRILINHILDMTVLHKVPALVVPQLKDILRDCCGLASIAVAFRKGVGDKSNLNMIVKVIEEISKNYPPNLKNINSVRRECKKSVKSTQLKFESILNSSKSKPVKDVLPIKNYHLIKSSNERVFIPESDHVNKLKNTGDFIGFNVRDSIDLTNDPTQQKPAIYSPLIVKKMKADKNRRKNKIEQLKRKQKK